MDFAFVYLQVTLLWWASAVTLVLAGAFSIFVVLFAARDVWHFIQYNRRTSGDRS